MFKLNIYNFIIKLTEFICCRIVLKKLTSVKTVCSNIPKEVLENNIELKVDWDESLKNFPECKLIVYYNITN